MDSFDVGNVNISLKKIVHKFKHYEPKMWFKWKAPTKRFKKKREGEIDKRHIRWNERDIDIFITNSFRVNLILILGVFECQLDNKEVQYKACYAASMYLDVTFRNSSTLKSFHLFTSPPDPTSNTLASWLTITFNQRVVLWKINNFIN